MSEVVRESLKSAVKGTALVFVAMVASTFIWFVTKILIVRMLTKEELGIYTLAITITSVAATIGSAGLPEGVTRFISIYKGESREDKVLSISRAALQLAAFFGLVITLLLLVLSWPISRVVFYKQELWMPLMIVSFFALFQILSLVQVGALRGLGIIRPQVYFINLGQPIFFLVILLGMMVTRGLNLLEVSFSYTVALFFTFVCISIYAYKHGGLNRALFQRGTEYKDLLFFSLPLIGATMAGMIFSWTDTFMLGRYTGAASVGTYNVSVSLVKLLKFGPDALGFVFMPIAGALFSKGQGAELKRTYQVLTRWIFSLTLPLFFILFFFPEMTISFLFGERFLDASLPLAILSLGFLCNAFFGIMNILMIIMGYSRLLLNAAIFGAVLNVILNYVAIKHLGLGVIGAASATTISFFIVNVILAAILFKRTRIHPFKAAYLKPVAGSALVGTILYGVAKKIIFHFWLLPIFLGLFVFGYFGALLITHSIDEEDLDLLDAVLKRVGMNIDWLKRLLIHFSVRH